MRKNGLVQGWPRNGAQIRKSQNTEDLGKALQITKFRWNLDRKIREICWEARAIQNFLVSPNLDFQSSSDFPSPLHFQVPTKKLSRVPWSGPANKFTSRSWGRAKRWLRSWKWVGRRDIIHLWKPNPQKDSQITHSWNSRWPFYSFFRWIIKTRVTRDFHDFFEAINLKLLLRGFQGFFDDFFWWETWSQARVFFWCDGRVSDGWEVVACSSWSFLELGLRWTRFFGSWTRELETQQVIWKIL
jgi:hypothetical protein